MGNIFGNSQTMPGQPAAPQEPAAPTSPVTIAKGEIGVSEKSNPKRVIEYHKSTSLASRYLNPKTAWCSSFANYCTFKAGIKGTRSAWARSWEKWGVGLTEPEYGCIALYERNGPGGDSHVGFWVGEEGEFDLVLGGNQGDAVSIAKQPKSRRIALRRAA